MARTLALSTVIALLLLGAAENDAAAQNMSDVSESDQDKPTSPFLDLLKSSQIEREEFAKTGEGRSEYVFTIDKQHFDCLVQNIDAYLAVEREPVLVYLPKCPDVGSSPSRWRAWGAIADIKIKPGGSGFENLAEVLVLEKYELACIKNGAAGLVTSADLAGQLVVLDLSACGDDQSTFLDLRND